jgi:hypothetical protein
MGLREWMQRRMASYDGHAQLPTRASLMHRWFTDEQPESAEFGADGLTPELSEMLRRREEVSEALLDVDLVTSAGRVSAIPELQRLLRIYPHPVLYEALLLAYGDAGRWDEARGVAFAARARRRECERSPYSAIRLETDRLRDWTTEDVDEIKRERSIAPPQK